METRRAVLSVLFGALVGGCVPVVGAWALSSVVPGFQIERHLFTVFLLSIGGALIGMFVNLPSSMDDGKSGAGGGRGGAAWRGTPRGGFESRGGAGGRSETNTRSDARANAHRGANPNATPGGASSPSPTGAAGRAVGDLPRVDPIDQTGPLSRRSALNVLGLSAEPTGDEIRAAYRKLAREHHPDQHARHGAEAVTRATHRFRRVKQAYDILARDEELGI